MLDGVDEARQIVFDFLQKYASGPPPKGAEAHKVHLFQEYFGKSNAPVQSWPFSAGEDLEAFAEDIASTCERQAQEVGSGTIPFVIKLEGINAMRRFSLEHVLDDGEEESFPQGFVPRPTERGVLAQLMRHLESQARLNADMGLSQQRTMSAFLREMSQQNLEMMRDKVRNINLLEELITKKHERELAGQLADRQESRRDYIAQQMVPIAQTVATKFLGKGAVVPQPGRETPLEQAIMSVISAMSPQEMQGVLSALSPGNKIMMLELIQAFQAAKEAAAAPPSSEGNGSGN